MNSSHSTPKTVFEMTIGAAILARALRHHTRAQHFTRWMTWLAIGVAVVCCGLLWVLGRQQEGILLVVGVAGLLSLMPPVQERLARMILQRQFKEAAGQDDLSKLTCSLDADGITFASGGSKTQIAWTSFLKWREVDGLILLYRTSRFFNVLDTAQMAPEDVQRVRDALVKASR